MAIMVSHKEIVEQLKSGGMFAYLHIISRALVVTYADDRSPAEVARAAIELADAVFDQLAFKVLAEQEKP